MSHLPESEGLSRRQPAVDERVVHGAHAEHRHAVLLAEQRADAQRSGRRQVAPAVAAAGGVAAVTPPAVAGVGERGEHEEECGEDVGAPHDARHRLRVHGVRGEQQARPEGRRPARHATRQRHVRRGRRRVQQRVDEVEAGRPRRPAPGPAPQPVVDSPVCPKREDGEGAVGPVRAAVREARAPEVVVEQRRERRLPQHVTILQDRTAATATELSLFLI